MWTCSYPYTSSYSFKSFIESNSNFTFTVVFYLFCLFKDSKISQTFCSLEYGRHLKSDHSEKLCECPIWILLRAGGKDFYKKLFSTVHCLGRNKFYRYIRSYLSHLTPEISKTFRILIANISKKSTFDSKIKHL